MSDFAIKVERVSKNFKLPHEKFNSIKSRAINFYKLKRNYELQKALEDVSFEIKQGEFFGIVGRNGSGKSTLLKLLAGIYQPTSGQIHVNGTIVPFIELGVGFNPELTGRENVFLNGALLGFNRKEMSAMYPDIVSFAELEKFMDQKLKNYSSGMQVRLAFSIAIRARGDILLLDEVLAVGDAAFQQKCFDYFEELKREYKTVVFVSHDMSAIRRFCSRAVYIEDGEMSSTGTAIEIADTYVEKNISQEPASHNLKLPLGNKIDAKIIGQTETELTIKLSYSSNNPAVYAGISIIQNGYSLAEINTLEQLKLKNKGDLIYRVDLSYFNQGLYKLSVALFNIENKALLAIGKARNEFSIKNSAGFEFRGGPIKLGNHWESVK